FSCILLPSSYLTFLFHDTATHDIYTLSLHDALPILNFTKGLVDLGAECGVLVTAVSPAATRTERWDQLMEQQAKAAGKTVDEIRDRKSTRLNSSHDQISYAVFCLKKKKKKKKEVEKR